MHPMTHTYTIFMCQRVQANKTPRIKDGDEDLVSEVRPPLCVYVDVVGIYVRTVTYVCVLATYTVYSC